MTDIPPYGSKYRAESTEYGLDAREDRGYGAYPHFLPIMACQFADNLIHRVYIGSDDDYSTVLVGMKKRLTSFQRDEDSNIRVD